VTYTVVQTRRFARAYKKLHGNLVVEVDAAVSCIAADPSIGERKKGDLAALRVHKFRALGQLWLLGYSVDDAVRLVYLEAVGPHENFYRDLKR
jgi:hypothetical protein